MSLEQRYSWNDHLAECPKCNGKERAKRVKRNSKEGIGCFEKAYVIHIKDYLKSRVNHLEEEKNQVLNLRKSLMKRFIDEKDTLRARRLGHKIHQKEAYLARLDHRLAHDKELQKKF